MGILDQQLCFALYSAARAATNAYRERLDDLGLTYTQLLVLMCLWDQDGQPVWAIGDALQLDSGTLSPLLSRMEKQHFITRARDQKDARVVTIHLADRGRAIREQVRQTQSEMGGHVAMTDDELVLLKALARRFCQLDGGKSSQRKSDHHQSS